MKVLLFCLLVTFCVAQGNSDDDDFENIARSTPCWPTDVELVKRANEDCNSYAERVCFEAKAALKNCSMEMCVEETRLRCPFRDLIRSRANYYIKSVAEKAKIWNKTEAAEYCHTWYGLELGNITRLGAVWDMLYMLPCPHEELDMRLLTTKDHPEDPDPCFSVEKSGIAPAHPLAKFCYTSHPVELNIGTYVSTQCCYGSDLRLLVMGHKGAGTVDFSAKTAKHSTSEMDHFEEDVFPYLACCALSNNCLKYGAVRPAALQPEPTEVVRRSCEKMRREYKFKPYGDFEPPYARLDALEKWAKLNLTANSLVPTVELQQILAISKHARDEILNGRDPYIQPRPTTESHPSERPVEHTTEQEVTPPTEKTTVRHTQEPEAPPAHNAASSSKKENVEEKVDRELDKAIEAVLKGQTKKPATKKSSK